MQNQKVIVEFVPSALVGQQPQIVVKMENIPGSWPVAVQMLLEGLKAATMQAFAQMSVRDVAPQGFFVPGDLEIKR